MTTLADRFWSKVDKNGPTQPHMESECWVWTASTLPTGYGEFGVGRTNKRAHRISWDLVNGEIPNNLLVCHRCDNPGCVRPDHLFLGTHADNARDRDLKGRLRIPPTMRGEAHPSAKLTSAEAEIVRSSLERGKDLAARFGVSKALISLIRLGKRWPSDAPVDVERAGS